MCHWSKSAQRGMKGMVRGKREVRVDEGVRVFTQALLSVSRAKGGEVGERA